MSVLSVVGFRGRTTVQVADGDEALPERLVAWGGLLLTAGDGAEDDPEGDGAGDEEDPL